MENAVQQVIVQCFDKEWLEAIKSNMLEFIHHSPLKMIKHLRTFRGDLDLMDVTELNTKLLKSWDSVKAPATMFA